MPCDAGRRARLRPTLRSPNPALVLSRRNGGGGGGVIRHRRAVRARDLPRSALPPPRPPRLAAHAMAREPVACPPPQPPPPRPGPPLPRPPLSPRPHDLHEHS